MISGQDKILKATVSLQRERAFFSYLLMSFRSHLISAENTPIHTIGVNEFGHLYYDEQWVQELTSPQLLGVLCHEVLHIVRQDIKRRGRRDRDIWNIATDAMINWVLLKEKFTLPKGIIPTLGGLLTVGKRTYQLTEKMTSEELYELLYKDAEKIRVELKLDGDQSQDNGHGGFDVHLENDENEEHQSTGEGKTDAQRRANESIWKKRMAEAQTIAKRRGEDTGHYDQLIEATLSPTIDWRIRLLQFVVQDIPTDYTRRTPGRAFYATRVWTPRILRENLDLIVGVDASGSTSEDRKQFVSELTGVISAYPQVKARIIFWDTAVNPENDLVIDTASGDMLDKVKLRKVDGGTTLGCFTKYLEDNDYRANIYIILTDGHIEQKPVVPIGKLLFVLPAQGKDDIVSEYGDVCRLSDVNTEN